LSQVFCEARVALRFRLLNPGPRWGSVGVRASRIELGEKGDSCPFSAVPSVPVPPKRPVHLAVTGFLGIFLFSVAVQGYAATLTPKDDFNWPQFFWCFSGVK
jgi:hypothetical protein